MTGKIRKSSRYGFSLLELMTVVVIVGILSAVATPMLSRYLRKSKTVEAALNLRKIYDGESAYYNEERIDVGGTILTKQFLALSQTPSGLPGRDKRDANWEAWSSIRFNVDGPVLYSYLVVAAGSGSTAAFTARAIGDQNADNQTSLFERVGSVNSTTGEVEGGAAIYTLDELQ
ncbi:MAG: prepilin-type N-terminal cleavage/methylation domain-containing protein [Pseudomonadota bacterium]